MTERLISMKIAVLWRFIGVAFNGNTGVLFYRVINLFIKLFIYFFTLGIKDPEGFGKKIRRKLSE